VTGTERLSSSLPEKCTIVWGIKEFVFVVSTVLRVEACAAVEHAQQLNFEDAFHHFPTGAPPVYHTAPPAACRLFAAAPHAGSWTAWKGTGWPETERARERVY
jgi:hypothetical protein